MALWILLQKLWSGPGKRRGLKVAGVEEFDEYSNDRRGAFGSEGDGFGGSFKEVGGDDSGKEVSVEIDNVRMAWVGSV